MTVYIEDHLPVVKYNGLNTQKNTILGSEDKLSQNLVKGRLKLDVRPTGGTSEDYAEQIRANSAKTSGTFLGLDNESHLTATGTATIMSTRGVAVVDSTYTQTGGTVIGTYGQARADGTVAGSGFMAGIYGLVEEGGGAITASHVASAWLDSHRNTAVTAEHELLYMTNNGTATMDQAIFLYGGNKITNFAKFDTCSGMVSDTAETGGTSKKIKIDIDGVTHYINAYTG